MNFLLKFKSPKHETNFHENLEPYTSRMVVTHSVLVIAIVPLSPLVQYYTFRANSDLGMVIRRVALTWIVNIALLILSILLQKYRERLHKRHHIVRWSLDILYCLVAGFETYYYLEGSVLTSKTQNYFWGWWHALTAIIKINMISRWYLKLVAYLVLVLPFGIQTYIDVGNRALIVVTAQAVVFLALYTYFQERSDKMRFLEKQTLVEETEALREIMEQTTEAIVICGIDEGVLYKNSKKFEWWNESLPVEANLSKVLVENKTHSESVRQAFLFCFS